MLDPLLAFVNENTTPKRAIRFALGILLGLFVLKSYFHMSWNEVINGASLGSLSAEGAPRCSRKCRW